MPLFRVPQNLSRVLDKDLAFAGIPKRDDRGQVVDVHSLRHTFGTHLSKGGVPLRTAQAAMRHSDPKLTANVYTDPALLDVAGAMDALPKVPLYRTEDAEADRRVGEVAADSSPKAAPMLAPNSGNGCILGAFPDKMAGEGDTTQEGTQELREGPVYKGSLAVASADNEEKKWRPQGDLNPCRRRERAVSWTRLDDGDARRSAIVFVAN